MVVLFFRLPGLDHRELVVVQAAGEFRLAQPEGDAAVGDTAGPALEEMCLLCLRLSETPSSAGGVCMCVQTHLSFGPASCFGSSARCDGLVGPVGLRDLPYWPSAER